MTKLGPELTKLRVRRFVLQRDSDHSGVSGVGFVAEGVEFSNGTAVLSWRTQGTSTAVYPGGAKQVVQVHGHGGGTVIVWLDEGLTVVKPAELPEVLKPTLRFEDGFKIGMACMAVAATVLLFFL